MSNNSAPGEARLTAAWLAGGRLLDRLSMALTLLALGLAFWQQPAVPVQAGLLAAAVLGCLEKYYALRVAFDRRVFADWAKQWSTVGRQDPEVAMAEFDAALVSMGLRRRAGGPSRSLEERIAGSRTLYRKQALCLALQCVTLIGAAVARFALY